MKSLFTLFLSLFFFIALTAHAQNCAPETNFWYFGTNAGLNFNTGAPIPLSDGLVANYEGSATASDTNGNLLFYTDGVTVWNQNHQQMPNGFGLQGNPSTTQAALIVQQPDNDNIYYIFTAPSQGASGNEQPVGAGLAYSVVDMSLAGSLGDVTIKNQPLIYPAAEKLTAVKHANGCDIWVIGHQMNNNKFVAYLLTASGLITTPIQSFVGDFYSPLPADEEYVGYLKASPEGNLIANAKYHNAFEVFSFNKNTGNLALLYTIPQPGQPNGWTYGVEFSPDGTKLYGSYGTGFEGTPCLFQWDLTAGNQAAVIASKTDLYTYSVANSTTLNPRGMQMALDGKIYVAIDGGTSLGVINNPNTLGIACDFVPNGVSLPAPTGSGIGLPNFAPYLFAPQKPIINGALNVCISTTETFTATVNCQEPYLEWTSLGGASIVNTAGNSVTINFTQIGTDTLIVRNLNCSSAYDTLLVNVNECEPVSCDVGFGWIATDTIVCIGQTAIAHFQINNTTQATLVNTTTGVSTPLNPTDYDINIANVQQSACYNLLLNGVSCDTTVNFCVTANPPLSFSWAAIDTLVCQGEDTQIAFSTNATTIQLTHLNTGSVRQNPILPINILNIQADSCYSLYLSNGCDTTINFCIRQQGISYNAVQSLTICEGESVTVGTNIYTQSGVYTDVLSTVSGCDSTLSTTLIVNPDFEQDNNVQICTGETYTVGTNVYFETGVYQDVFTNTAGCDSTIVTHLSVTDFLSRSQSYNICNQDSVLVGNRYLSLAGTYVDTLTFNTTCDSIITTILTTKACDTLNIQSCRVLIPNAFSPNNDQIHDTFGVIVPCNDIQNFTLQIYNRWGQKVFETNNPTQEWDGNYKGQACPMGAYAWYVSYDQTQENFLRYRIDRGNVTLLK